ncbi:MAG: class I SAM-dependent methyltransferase [Candidatus Paceibacterota bacterium]
MTDFDYQWKYLSNSPYLEHNSDRVKELLDLTMLPPEWFNGKYCLDVGCGSGRYTYAMQQLGAKVISIDNSIYALQLTSQINKHVFLHDITKAPFFIRGCALTFCYGVIHHTPNPRKAFSNLAKGVPSGGYLFVMVYRDSPVQKRYEGFRKLFKSLPAVMRLPFVYMITLVFRYNYIPPFYHPVHTVHGWWDALSPTYNFTFTEDEIVTWFREEGFSNLYTSTLPNICMTGLKL